jgi:hypothetical protein
MRQSRPANGRDDKSRPRDVLYMLPPSLKMLSSKGKKKKFNHFKDAVYLFIYSSITMFSCVFQIKDLYTVKYVMNLKNECADL